MWLAQGRGAGRAGLALPACLPGSPLTYACSCVFQGQSGTPAHPHTHPALCAPAALSSALVLPGCRQAPAAGAGTADLQWLRPRRVMHQPDDGIASMAAGSFSTAAITGAGELFLWGTLLTEDASAALVKQSGEWVVRMCWKGWGVHDRGRWKSCS